MRVIVINPWNQSVEYTEHNGNFRDLYRLLSGPTGEDEPAAEVHCFDIVRLGPGITMFADDEGLLQEHQAYFQLGANETPFAGRGVITGESADGETAEVPMSVERVRGAVSWLPIGASVTPPPPVVTTYDSHDELLAAMANPPPSGAYVIDIPE
jgi:hypothetical protein